MNMLEFEIDVIARRDLKVASMSVDFHLLINFIAGSVGDDDGRTMWLVNRKRFYF